MRVIGHFRHCHWFDKSDTSKHRLCVWHNGVRGTCQQQIRVGKSDRALVQVSEDFGCIAWESDEEVMKKYQVGTEKHDD